MVQTKLGTNKSISKMVGKKRVLIILPVSWGGVVHTTLAIVEQLCKELSDTSIFVLKAKDKYSRMFKRCEKIIVLDNLYPLEYSRDNPLTMLKPKNLANTFINCSKMRSFIESINPHLIYLVAPYPQFLCIANDLKRRKVLLTVHAVFPRVTDVIKNMGVLNGLIYFLTEVVIKSLNPHTIIVHTLSDAFLIREKFRLNSRIIKAVLPIWRFSSTQDKSYKSTSARGTKGKDKIVLLYFGYIVPGKGINVFLEALNKVCDNSRLSNLLYILIVGKGNIPKEKLSIVQKKCNVTVINTYVPEKYIPVIFSYADIIVLPYVFHKGFSGVLRLAIEYSKPIIASDTGDLPEIVGSNNIGILFKRNDWRDLANKIEYFLNNRYILHYIKDNIESYKRRISKSSYAKIFKIMLNS